MTINRTFVHDFETAIAALKAEQVYKRLNYLESRRARAPHGGRGEVIVLSSNNYLGLANDPPW